MQTNFNIPLNEIQEIELELTGICNLKCPLCTRNYLHANHQKVKNVRPIEDIIKQLDTFRKLKHINLAGTVSEPTLYPDIIKLLEYIISRDIEIDFYSNASILDLNLWENIGKLLNKPEHKIIFTVCGTNQEIHEIYRKGSKLENILLNLKEFQKHSSRDYGQYIVFDYNKEDSKQSDKILKYFNNFFIIGSEGRRLLNEYNNKFSEDIKPIKEREIKINAIFKLGETKFKRKSKYQIDCISYNQKRLYIDQFGKYYACYSQAEFYKDSNIEFTEPNNFNYTNIKNFKYSDCLKCEQQSIKMIKDNNLQFIF